jgi:hypothetical protein
MAKFGAHMHSDYDDDDDNEGLEQAMNEMTLEVDARMQFFPVKRCFLNSLPWTGSH